MNVRAATTAPLALVTALTLALATGCGDTCPTETAYVDPGRLDLACSAPAPQQVSVRLNLCEDCAHTNPTCDVEFVGGDQIHLDTLSEVCEENRGCDFNTDCSFVTCSFRADPGTYDVIVNVPGATPSFSLIVPTSGDPTCGGLASLP